MAKRNDLVESYLGWLRRDIAARDSTANRRHLGERELRTIDILLRLSGLPPFIAGANEVELIVDAGCGDRYIESGVLARGFEYRGLDISDVDFESELFPLEDKSASAVISLAVLEHLHDPTTFFREIRRVLRPGGLLVLSTPNWAYSASIFYNDPTHVHPYTPLAVERVLAMFGFENVRTYPGTRCKHDWFYRGRHRFRKCYYLLPFRSDVAWAPEMIRGHSRSLFALAVSPGH